MDKSLSIVLLSIVLVCHTATALICYNCKGPECDSKFPNLQQVDCELQGKEFFIAQHLPVENLKYACVTLHGKYNNEAYTDRTCTPESITCKHLSKVLIDNKEEVLNCKTCTTDLCNGQEVIPPALKTEDTVAGAFRVKDGFILIVTSILALMVANHN